MSDLSEQDFRSLQEKLKSDTRIKVAGLDVDGILRGKIMSKTKFLSAVKNGGFGMPLALSPRCANMARLL